MTVTASALNSLSTHAAEAMSARQARGGHGRRNATLLLLAPVALAAVFAVSVLLSLRSGDGDFGAWAVLWLSAVGAMALFAGMVRDAALSSVDAVREHQGRQGTPAAQGGSVA
jgi:hypothetical protein